jgi:hypothetical protein
MNISIKVIYAVCQEFELLDCQIHIDVWSIESNFSFAQLMFKMKRIDFYCCQHQCKTMLLHRSFTKLMAGVKLDILWGIGLHL